MLSFSPRSVRTVPALQIVALVLAHPSTATAAPEPATTFQVRERVVVAEFQSPSRLAREARQAQDSLQEALRQYPSMEVLSADSWEDALRTARAPRHGCIGDECLTVAAQLLHADTLVTGSLMKHRHAWVLTLGATTPSSASPAKASLRMQQPKHIEANVRLCLERLLTIWPQVTSPSEEQDTAPDPGVSAADPGIVRIPALDHRRDHSTAALDAALAPAAAVMTRHVVRAGNDLGNGAAPTGQGRP